MNMYNLSAVVLMIFMCISCNAKTRSNNLEEEFVNPSYVINESLSSRDYSDFEGYFPQDGLVPTAEVAFQIAESILINIYGEDVIDAEKPFSINLENDVWLIEGFVADGMKGGSAYIEINKNNGTILKIVHTE